MKQSFLFTKTIKDLPKDESSYNAQILIQGGFIDKLGAGIYTFLPLGLRVLNKINNIIREEMERVGGQEILMPALTPKDIWQKTDRWDNFDALFKLLGSDNKEYALGATHEEVVTPLAQNFTHSWRDLPLAIFQIQTKFRNEKRAKAGLIRGREFLMKDLYSFHSSEEDLNQYYEQLIKAYFKIFERLGLKDITYLTYASGGAFSPYSHEFQTLCSSGEDLIYICNKCSIAINQEIIDEQKICPECGGSDFKEEKAVEVANIFKLGTKFSKAFGLHYIDQVGEKQDVIMGCYGIGPSRVMGTIAEVCHDEKGVKWPREIAPFSIHLISLKENESAEKIYQELMSNNWEVLYDDRDNVSHGEKFADADLIGCPLRIVLSSKTLAKNQVELKFRDQDELIMLDIKELLDYLKKYV